MTVGAGRREGSLTVMVCVPPEIFGCRDVGHMARLLCATAWATNPRSIRELAANAGVDSSRASRVCNELAKAGWMRLVRAGREMVPVPALPRVVEEERARRLCSAAEIAAKKGEFLMKCWLDFLVASDRFVDNARPGFLRNPLSGEPLEFDRYYFAGAAFEFNGPQHYGTTERYPDEKEFKEQRARDLMKRGLSDEGGVVLVVVTAEDLTFDGMTRKIPEVLPRARVERVGPYAKALERLGRQYRKRAATQAGSQAASRDASRDAMQAASRAGSW